MNYLHSHGEVICVPDEMKGRVIGKRGWFLHLIMERSGARLTPCDGGFFIEGNEMQIEHARNMIKDKLVSCILPRSSSREESQLKKYSEVQNFVVLFAMFKYSAEFFKLCSHMRSP